MRSDWSNYQKSTNRAHFIPSLKIAGRKRPALVDPSHKVRQGGKRIVWDGQTYGRTDGHFQSTSGPLPVTSSPLPVHFQSIWAPYVVI